MKADLLECDMTTMVKLQYQSENVEITSISCSPRTSLLLIGLENGKMTFYDLKELRPIWHYGNEDGEFGAVTKIFIQEPENDPRKTCWVWQCSQKHDENVIQMELYHLEFLKRDIYTIIDAKSPEKRRRSQYSGLKQGTVFSYIFKG